MTLIDHNSRPPIYDRVVLNEYRVKLRVAARIQPDASQPRGTFQVVNGPHTGDFQIGGGLVGKDLFEILVDDTTVVRFG